MEYLIDNRTHLYSLDICVSIAIEGKMLHETLLHLQGLSMYMYLRQLFE